MRAKSLKIAGATSLNCIKGSTHAVHAGFGVRAQNTAARASFGGENVGVAATVEARLPLGTEGAALVAGGAGAYLLAHVIDARLAVRTQAAPAAAHLRRCRVDAGSVHASPAAGTLAWGVARGAAVAGVDCDAGSVHACSAVGTPAIDGARANLHRRNGHAGTPHRAQIALLALRTQRAALAARLGEGDRSAGAIHARLPVGA